MSDKLQLSADVTFQAAEGEAAPGMRRFTIEAYTGSEIRQGWSKEPVVIDLAGMRYKQKTPIVMAHDYGLGSVLGQTTSVRVEAGKLIVEGEILATSEAAKQVVALAEAGYQWQASVGADVRRVQKVDADATTFANERSYVGPLRLVKTSNLREVSFVTLGADSETSVAIAAEEAAEEFTMADTANTQPADEVVETAKVEASATVAVEPETVKARDYDAEIKSLETKVQNMEKLLATRESRGPAIHVAESVDHGKVIEAALCLQGGLPNADKAFDSRTLEAADKAKRTTSISEVLIEAARANGYSGGNRINAANAEPVLKAAFATHDISNLLSAVVNKFLLQGFNAVERVWEDISAIRSVNDFKAVNMFRLNGSFRFQKVGNSGELKAASASDYKRSVSAETYGITTSLTRQDMINDDLNALSQIPQRIGRGAALSLNDVIWGEFQSSNSSYYQSVTAGSGNALSFDSLSAATTAYRKLSDPDGNPLAIPPRILLVPPELELTAARLMTSSALIASSLGSTSSKVVEGSTNVLAGRYRVVVSNYLTSASTWWLVADAADLPAMDVVFLNGQQAPTIEQVAADYATLGVMMRGYMDFGVIKSEPLSCLRMATA